MGHHTITAWPVVECGATALHHGTALQYITLVPKWQMLEAAVEKVK